MNKLLVDMNAFIEAQTERDRRKAALAMAHSLQAYLDTLDYPPSALEGLLKRSASS